MKFAHYEFNISGHYASAIINGDYSGLDDKEERELNAFLDSIPDDAKGRGHWDGFGEDEDYQGFSRCDVCGMMSDCYTARYMFPA